MIDVYALARMLAVYGIETRIHLTQVDYWKGGNRLGTVLLYGTEVELESVKAICLP